MSRDDEDTLSVAPERVVAFLRALADRAERDRRFAATLAGCFAESGLLLERGADRLRADSAMRNRPGRRASGVSSQTEALDPFALWRAQGEVAVRAALDAMDIAQLKAVVRTSRLDPAHVSARWTAHERIVTLIVDQVKARLNHGRAFERI